MIKCGGNDAISMMKRQPSGMSGFRVPDRGRAIRGSRQDGAAIRTENSSKYVVLVPDWIPQERVRLEIQNVSHTVGGRRYHPCAIGAEIDGKNTAVVADEWRNR